MKKTILMLFLAIMLIGILASCSIYNTNTDTNTLKDSQVDISTDSTKADSNKDTNSNIVMPDLLCEKYGDKVYFSIEENNKYYYEIKDYEQVTDCFEIPTEEDGTYKVGAYLKFINSYDELIKHIIPVNLDVGIFEENYVICVKQCFMDAKYIQRFIGYYDLENINGEYQIFLDHYVSNGNAIVDLELSTNIYTNYIVVPKAEIEHTDQVQQISVNGKEKISTSIFEDNGEDIEDIYEFLYGIPSYVRFVEHNTKSDLPKNAESWVIKAGSELEKQYGLKYDDNYSGRNFRIILYLPIEPNCDFQILEKETKNGDLYLTVGFYSEYNNNYLEENNVHFYDLYIHENTISQLSENYNVFINVRLMKAEDVSSL